MTMPPFIPLTRRRAGAVLVACALAPAAALPGTAQALPTLHHGDRGRSVQRLQHGLHIGADGVFGRGTVRAVKRFQRRHGLLVDGIVGPQTRGALGLAAPSPASTSAGAATGTATTSQPSAGNGSLQGIAQCESGGNPHAVGGGGQYRGKYQFTQATWQSVGGAGDPAAAPEAEQDRRAAMLYQRSGSSNWPVCGG
jgi:peptidoglycan hydrolase-like protein with peptidoglycan-binding domain